MTIAPQEPVDVRHVNGMVEMALDWTEGQMRHIREEAMQQRLAVAERLGLIEHKGRGRRLTENGHRFQCKRHLRNASVDVMMLTLRKWADGPVEIRCDRDGKYVVSVYPPDGVDVCGVRAESLFGDGPSIEAAVMMVAPLVRQLCADEARSLW